MLRILIVLLAPIVVACSGVEDLEEDASQGSMGRFGLVQVSYDHDWAKSGEAVLLTATAQFVRYAEMDRDQVARLLALPLDPKTDLPEMDSCKVYDLSVDDVAEEALEKEENGSVELMEAGNLHIQTESQTVTLLPRHFPWLLPFISGVIYGEAHSTVVEKAGVVHASADGGEFVGAFSTELGSPDLPQILYVGEAQPSQTIFSTKQKPLVLRWMAQDPPNDVAYAEIRYRKDKRDQALRCRLQDDGVFEIPQSFLSRLSGKTTLEIARLRRTFFSTSGMERAELRVTIRDTATVQF